MPTSKDLQVHTSRFSIKMLSHVPPDEAQKIEQLRIEAPAPETPGHTPRLIISKIIQNNFKSYAGTVEIGPFHKVLILYCSPSRPSSVRTGRANPMSLTRYCLFLVSRPRK